MRRESAGWFVCPACGHSLSLSLTQEEGGQVERGRLSCVSCTQAYPIQDGVPILLASEAQTESLGPAKSDRQSRMTASQPAAAEGVARTRASFSHKWDRFPAYAVGNADHEKFYDLWTASKLGLDTQEELHAYFRDKHRILDVGCGVGQKLRMMARHSPGRVFGFDLSSAALHAYRNTRGLGNVSVAQSDLFRPPFRPGQFDFVIADGVLHHTPDTRKAFLSIVPLLASGGAILIHVYKKMTPLREWADEFLRERISALPPEEAWEACKPITALGKALTDLHVDIAVPEDIPYLDIKAGKYDLQRFVYYQVLKCFWNDIFTFEENNFGVFDHYHPTYAHKHTEEEVVGWFEEAGLQSITVHRRSPNGISVLAKAREA